MATKGAIAARKAQAIERLSASMNILSERLGVQPVTTGKRHRDPAYAQMQELEALADWSEDLVRAVEASLASAVDAAFDLSDLTTEALRIRAEARGIEVKGLKRDDLIAALAEAGDEPRAADAPEPAEQGEE